jgi:hypothetical protein
MSAALTIGLLQGAERFRGLLVAGRDLEAEGRHAGLHGRVRHGGGGGRAGGGDRVRSLG